MTKLKRIAEGERASVDQVLKDWCYVENSYVRGMQPAGSSSPAESASPPDDAVRNWGIAQKVLGSSSLRRRLVVHVVDSGFTPESFRLYEGISVPTLPRELLDVGLTHDRLKKWAWKQLRLDIDQAIRTSPAPLGVKVEVEEFRPA